MLLPTRVINVTGAFLYPAYASYKELSRRPADAAELERWLMYWALLGAWTAVEGVLGWFLEWIPLYTLTKTALFLYLAQRGNKLGPYLYCNGLAPLFAENEGEIDAFLGSLSGRASSGARGGVWWAWDQLRRALGLSQEQASMLSNASGIPQPTPVAAHPGAGGPIGAGNQAYAQQAFGLVSNLASRYMPAALGAVYAAGNQALNAAGGPGSPSASRSGGGTLSGSISSSSTTRGFDLPPMPPVPSTPIGSSTTSRTFAFASSTDETLISARTETRVRTASSTRNSSDGSLSTGSASLAGSGFAEIRREEADGAGSLETPPHTRRTSSSWMRWSKDAKDKAE